MDQSDLKVCGRSYGWGRISENKIVVNMGLKCGFVQPGKQHCRLRNKRHAGTDTAVTCTYHTAFTAAANIWFGCIDTGIIDLHMRHVHAMIHYLRRCLIMQLAHGFIDRHDATQRQHRQHGDEDPVKNVACILVHIQIIVLTASPSKPYMINLYCVLHHMRAHKSSKVPIWCSRYIHFVSTGHSYRFVLSIQGSSELFIHE